MEQVIKMLVKQLVEKGMTEGEISSCVSCMSNIINDHSVICSEDLNHEMREAGWQNFKMNDESFRMVSSAFRI